jgi:hypothetical protein
MANAANDQCTHEQVEVRLRCPECGEDFDRRSLSRAELEANAIDLPDREAMSLLGSGLLGGGLPLGGAAPTDPGAVPAPGAAPGGQGLTGGVDPMGLLSKFTPDTSGAGAQPYSPETSSSSQT